MNCRVPWNLDTSLVNEHQRELFIGGLKYSGTSIKGPSEKGTTSLQMTLPISPKVYTVHVHAIHFRFPKRGQPPYNKGQNGWPLYSEVPL